MTSAVHRDTRDARARFGAGLGLPNIRNSADEFLLESTPVAHAYYAVRLA